MKILQLRPQYQCDSLMVNYRDLNRFLSILIQQPVIMELMHDENPYTSSRITGYWMRILRIPYILPLKLI